MADLDDFFAKRDKKKSKGKKFDTADDLAKVLEQKAKEKKKMETGKSNYSQEGGRTSPGPGLPAGDDDEWLEAEEKQPDFTGLKIQELVLSDDDELDSKSQDGRASGDEGGNEGPWNKKTKDAKKSTEDEPEKEKEETSEDKPQEATDEENSKDKDQESTEGKKYIPPALKKQMEGGGGGGTATASAPPGAYVPPSRRTTTASPLAPLNKKKGTAPTLADEESFPSLS